MVMVSGYNKNSYNNNIDIHKGFIPGTLNNAINKTVDYRQIKQNPTGTKVVFVFARQQIINSF